MTPHVLECEIVTELDDNIRKNVAGPAKASGDAGLVEQRKLSAGPRPLDTATC